MVIFVDAAGGVLAPQDAGGVEIGTCARLGGRHGGRLLPSVGWKKDILWE